MTDLLYQHLDQLAGALPGYRAQARQLADWGTELAAVLGGGGRLLAAGNGGSAAQASHLVAELVGKLDVDRPPMSAVALNAETCGVTAIANDYGYAEVFTRQVRAHGRPGDVLVLLSTSGRSANLLAAARAGAELGMRVWALTGPQPNPLAGAAQRCLAVPAADGKVVQELHLTAVHLLCGYVDQALGVASERDGGAAGREAAWAPAVG
jgi:D-sedoheptulose 7-phosphate isomerase